MAGRGGGRVGYPGRWTVGPGLYIGPIDGLMTYPEGARLAGVVHPTACTSLFTPGRYELTRMSKTFDTYGHAVLQQFADG